jgi:epoxyqueuosine reductase QueG
MKEAIREFALETGADDVGFGTLSTYRSPMSPPMDSIFPGARTFIVVAYRELSSCESPSPQIAMNGRLDLMEFSRSCNYKLVRFLERRGAARAMSVPASYPMEMSRRTKGTVGEFSLRHAAVASGLGAFGRHNLVVHPRFGSRVVFTAVLTDLDLPPDAPIEGTPCTDCGLCVQSCPGAALSEAGKTDVLKCLKNSQPYGLGTVIRFWSGYADASPEERKAMLKDETFWAMYQAGFIGFQYFCFNCLSACPVGRQSSA